MQSVRGFRRAALPIALAAAFVWGGLANLAKADFTLIDDFESYVVGTPINGQGYWLAEAGANPVAAGVSADPVVATNHVMNIGDGGFTSGRLGHRETINTDPALRVVQGSTATLFFRVAWNVDQADTSLGMSDVANPISDVIFNSFDQFESQFILSFSPGADDVAVRDGGSARILTTDVSPLNWYNIWMVIDNANDTTQLFIQGGAFASQTQLSYLGDTTFQFRNGLAGNDLLTFFIATGRNTSSLPPNPTENIGPVYVDDLYIDTTGVNLVNPVPEPSTLTLSSMVAIALVFTAFRRRCS